MATIIDVINEIDAKDISYQLLTQGNTDLNICGKKDKYLRASFCSSPENIAKEAVILWVDKDKLKSALEKAKKCKE